MSSREFLLFVVLHLAALAATDGQQVCNDTTAEPFAADCAELSLCCRNLDSIDLSTFNFTNLKKIHLQNNNLTEMPPIHPSAKATLQGLYVFDNKIDSVPSSYFSDFRILTELSLFSNRLTEMPTIPDSLKRNITHLYMSDNNISSLPAHYFSSFFELSELTLRMNKISSISTGNSLRHLSKLRRLDFDQMNCDDCTTLQILKELAAMSNVTQLLIVSQNGTNMTDYPCHGDLSDKSLQQLKSTTCRLEHPSTAASPTTTKSPTTTMPAVTIAVGTSDNSFMTIGIPFLVFGILLVVFALGMMFLRTRSYSTNN